MQLRPLVPPSGESPISLQLIEPADGSSKMGGSRFCAPTPRQEDVSKLINELRTYEQRLAEYELGYLRLSVDGEEVAIFAPRDTVCEPFRVPTTASFIEITGEDFEGDLLLAVFPLTHLDPCRRSEAHRLSASYGKGQSITLILSLMADEAEDPLSYWLVRLECGAAGPECGGTSSHNDMPLLVVDGCHRIECLSVPTIPLLQPNTNPLARIVVVGIGSSGSNTVDTMIEAGMHGVTFAALNTDLQALQLSRAAIKVQLGSKFRCGLGAGSDPEIGRRAAIESTEKIAEVLQGADMVLVTTGMGGGTGTGAAPVVANLAKELGALAVAVVTTPFSFEGRRKTEKAAEGVGLLCERADTVFTLPNERLLQTLSKSVSFRQALAATDHVVRQATQTILDLVAAPGLINLDFAVVRAVLANAGSAFLGTGRACGELRALEALQQAISSPLLEAAALEGAKDVLINITGGSDLTLYEVSEASSVISKAADDDANIIFGAVIDETLRDMLKITVIATGAGGPKYSNFQPLTMFG